MTVDAQSIALLPATAGGKPVRLACEAMGTRFEPILAPDGREAQAVAAGEAALDEIRRADARLSRFRTP